jgi:serine phosphatase RsbU (regulator of sigma subunit)
VQLRRLLGPDILSLLDAMATAVPALKVAIVDADGMAVATSADWPASGLDEARSRDRVLRDERVGALAWLGDVPEALIEGWRLSISLLLHEKLDKHDLARETLERYREINVLYRSSETIGASLDADEVARLLVSETERVIPSDAREVVIGDERPDDSWRPALGLIEQVRAAGRPDIASWPAAAPDGLASGLCVPVRAGEKVLGVVVLGRNVGGRPFTASDEKLLLGLASQAGVALERARLHEQETLRLRLEEELAVARRIQLTLLPSRLPVVAGWSFAATYQAARQVGGDFYDFLDHALDERRIGLVIADVTGKGVPAALMMAYSRAVLRAESLAGGSPIEILANSNRLIMQERRSRPFLSAFYGELDLDSGRLLYANAGHDAPLLVEARGRAWRELDAHGVILGAFGDLRLEAHDVALGPGDTLILFTDGVTEARDSRSKLFGDERLARAALAGAAAADGAGSVLQSIVGAVDAFTQGAERADDLTILVTQREGG